MATPARAQTFSISELAREFEITTRSIRYYGDKGLLAPGRSGQTRVYTAADRTILRLILRGKRLGFSLLESHEMIELYDPTTGNVTQLETLLRKIDEKRAVLQEQLTDIRVMQRELERVERRCREALSKPAPKRGTKLSKATTKPGAKAGTKAKSNVASTPKSPTTSSTTSPRKTL